MSKYVCYAAMAGDLEGVKHAIANGEDMYGRDSYGLTPLHNAALMGHTHVARYLINKGALVQEQDEHGNTPLSLATDNNHRGMIKLLEREIAEEMNSD